MNMVKPIFITVFTVMNLYGSDLVISSEHHLGQQHFVESSKAPAGLKGYLLYLLNMVANHKKATMKKLFNLHNNCHDEVICYQSHSFSKVIPLLRVQSNFCPRDYEIS